MLSSFVAFFNKHVLFDETQQLISKPNNRRNFIYRDELSSKKTSTSNNKLKKPLLAKEREEKDIVINKRSEEKGVIRVKVVMTKQEAARLLSKCREGGVLGFNDAANEIVQIPINRVSVQFNTNSSDSSGLASIPEDI